MQWSLCAYHLIYGLLPLWMGRKQVVMVLLIFYLF